MSSRTLRSSKATAAFEATMSPILNAAHSAIHKEYETSKPRKYKEYLSRMVVGYRKLDAAVSGQNEDVQAYCLWVENDFGDHPLPDPLRFQYCFAVLKILLDLVEERSQEVATMTTSSSQTLLAKNTPEGFIMRMSTIIGCICEHVNSWDEEVPADLFTTEWLDLLVGLVQAFSVGKIPRHDVADMAAELVCSIVVDSESKVGEKLLKNAKLLSPSVIGVVLAASQRANLSINMFRLAHLVIPTPGKEREAVLRKILPPTSWDAITRGSLVEIFGAITRGDIPAVERTFKLINGASSDNRYLRPRGFHITGLIVDRVDLLTTSMNRQRINNVYAFIDPSGLLLKPYNDDGGINELVFGLNRIVNLADRGDGKFTFSTAPKAAGGEGANVKLNIHMDEGVEFYNFLQRCMQKKPTTELDREQAGPALAVAPDDGGIAPPDAVPSTSFDADDDFDDGELREQAEATANAKAESIPRDAPCADEALSPSPGRGKKFKKPAPAIEASPTTKASKQDKSTAKSKTSPPPAVAPSGRSCRSAAATASKKMTAMVDDQASSQASSQAVPEAVRGEAASSKSPTARKKPSTASSEPARRESVSPAPSLPSSAPVISDPSHLQPQADDDLLPPTNRPRTPDIHFPEPSQQVAMHPSPARGQITYSKRRSPTKRPKAVNRSASEEEGDDLAATLANAASVNRRASTPDEEDESKTKRAAKNTSGVPMKTPLPLPENSKMPRVKNKASKVLLSKADSGDKVQISASSNATSNPVSSVDDADDDAGDMTLVDLVPSQAAKPATRLKAGASRTKPASAAPKSQLVGGARSRKAVPRSTKQPQVVPETSPDANEDRLPSPADLPWQTQSYASVPATGRKRSTCQSKGESENEARDGDDNIEPDTATTPGATESGPSSALVVTPPRSKSKTSIEVQESQVNATSLEEEERTTGINETLYGISDFDYAAAPFITDNMSIFLNEDTIFVNDDVVPIEWAGAMSLPDLFDPAEHSGETAQPPVHEAQLELLGKSPQEPVPQSPQDALSKAQQDSTSKTPGEPEQPDSPTEPKRKSTRPSSRKPERENQSSREAMQLQPSKLALATEPKERKSVENSRREEEKQSRSLAKSSPREAPEPTLKTVEPSDEASEILVTSSSSPPRAALKKQAVDATTPPRPSPAPSCEPPTDKPPSTTTIPSSAKPRLSKQSADVKPNITPAVSSPRTPTVKTERAARPRSPATQREGEAESAATSRGRKRKEIVDLTQDEQDEAEGGPLFLPGPSQASGYATDAGTRPRKRLAPSPSTPLSRPTPVALDLRASSPSSNPLDSLPTAGRPARVARARRASVFDGFSVSTPPVTSRERKPEPPREVDHVSDGAPASRRFKARRDEASPMAASTGALAKSQPPLKASLCSPPIVGLEVRPVKRARFDLPSSTEAAAVDARKALRSGARANSTHDSVHSLFQQFFEPLSREFAKKVEAPSRAIQKAHRQVKLSAGVTVEKWSQEGDEKLDALANSFDQRSELFYTHMRDEVLPRMKKGSKKRHAFIQTICADGGAKPTYPASLF